MKEKESTKNKLENLTICSNYKGNEDLVDEVLSTDWRDEESANKAFSKYIVEDQLMSEEEEIHHELGSLANCLDYKYKEELTNEILNTDWENYESAKKILDKYLNWLVNPIQFPSESRNKTKNYLEKALANENYDFAEIVNYAEMAYDESKQGDPRRVFEAIYRYISENKPD